MRNPVVVVLYRHLARLARMHDRDPALKTLLVLGHTLEYHSHGAQWVTREVDQQRGLHAVGCAFFAGGNIYRPTRSLQDFVREQFRAESGDPGRLDTAFAALAELSKNVECAAALPRSAAADAADASPAEAASAGAWTPGEAPRAGAVLVAPVAQVAPSFGRSLLLLLRHSGAGSLGVVLNKPSPLALVHAARLLGRDEEMGLPRQAGGRPALSALSARRAGPHQPRLAARATARRHR